MERLFVMPAVVATIAAGLLVSPVFPAHAAGPYDGTWTIDMPASGQGAPGEFGCPALRIQVRIVDSQVQGTLQRTGTGTTVETGGSGSSAAPVTGSVSPDGMLNAQWSGYHATGRLEGDKGKLNVQRTCGPETATATRTAR
jgi:hypothetical protein